MPPRSARQPAAPKNIEAAIRRIVREENANLASPAKDRSLITVPECMRRYRVRRDVILSLIDSDELAAVLRTKGKNGRPQWLVKSDSAEHHPRLGGG